MLNEASQQPLVAQQQFGLREVHVDLMKRPYKQMCMAEKFQDKYNSIRTQL